MQWGNFDPGSWRQKLQEFLEHNVISERGNKILERTGLSKQPSEKLDLRPENFPTVSQLTEAAAEEQYRAKYRRTMRDVIFALITAAAIAILIANFLLPVFRVYGTSMTPTLTEGELTVAVKTERLQAGDLVAFYYNNKILIKRVIATQGEWVDIDKEGNVYVDGNLLDEPYVQNKSLGDCDIELPYQVPDGRIFVMGDHRNVSVDSRTTAIGCVSQEQIAGKLVFLIWPMTHIGTVH